MKCDNILKTLFLQNIGEQTSFGLVNKDISCPIDLPLTCQNKTEIGDSCCFEHPGGIFLQTQFWDYRPSKGGLNDTQLEKELGPLDAFTIHGLWPDNCDGGFEQFCDKSLFIDDVYYLLSAEEFNGKDAMDLEISGKDLLQKLEKLWKSNTGNDESLWIHEFNKHGSCINTIKPNCYKQWQGSTKAKNVFTRDELSYFRRKAVYDYFRITYNLYSKANTFEILEKYGIIPSNETEYTKEQIQNALKKEFGTNESSTEVYINCDSNNALNEIWYYYLLKGSLLEENFVAIDSLANRRSRCRDTGIKFYPKGTLPKRNGNHPSGPSTRGLVRISGYDGHLIKNGHWMTKGTPANFELIKSPFGNYYLKSRTGYCSLSNSKLLNCNFNINNAGQFDYDEKKRYLGYSNSFEWSAETYPRGNKQSSISLNNKDSTYQFKLKFVPK